MSAIKICVIPRTPKAIDRSIDRARQQKMSGFVISALDANLRRHDDRVGGMGVPRGSSPAPRN